MSDAPNFLDRIVQLEKANADERYEAGMYKCLYEAWEKRASGYEEEIREWRECAEYDPKMEGPQFKGWNRSALDRCRKRFVEGDRHD